MLVLLSSTAFAEENTKSGILADVQDSLTKTWQAQRHELYLPVNTWHNRCCYSAEKIASYNEQPWGLGISKYRIDQDGDWHSLYIMAFLDSHSNVEPIVGYGFQKVWRNSDGFRLGLGYTLGITLRESSSYLLPTPLLAPLVSIGYKDLSVQSTYIVGGEGYGNILFTWLSWQLQ